MFDKFHTFQQTESRIMQALEQANAQQDLSKSLLRLTYLLQQSASPAYLISSLTNNRLHLKGLRNKNSQSAIELLMTQPSLLENLRKAHMGNYGVILSLLGCLDRDGIKVKKLVDRVIDSGEHEGRLVYYCPYFNYLLQRTM